MFNVITVFQNNYDSSFIKNIQIRGHALVTADQIAQARARVGTLLGCMPARKTGFGKGYSSCFHRLALLCQLFDVTYVIAVLVNQYVFATVGTKHKWWWQQL